MKMRRVLRMVIIMTMMRIRRGSMMSRIMTGMKML